MKDFDDRPVRQHLKVLTVLDCVAGVAGDEPIGIVTYGHRCEVEQPIALTLRDVALLAQRLIAVLAHHNKPLAGEICDRFFSGQDDPFQVRDSNTLRRRPATALPPTLTKPVGHPGRWGSARRSQPKAIYRTGGLRTTGLILRIKYDHSPELAEHKVIGAYQNGTTVCMMYRFHVTDPTSGRTRPFDSVLKLGPRSTLHSKLHDPTEYLPLPRWRQFGRLSAGTTFKIGAQTWRKMGVAQLRRKVSRRTFRFAYPTGK